MSKKPMYDKAIQQKFNDSLAADNLNEVRKLYRSGKIDLGEAIYQINLKIDDDKSDKNFDFLEEVLLYLENRLPDDSDKEDYEWKSVGWLVNDWQDYLGRRYGIHMMVEDYGMPDYEVLSTRARESLTIVKRVYYIVKETNNVLDNYKRNVMDHKTARDKLGEIMMASLAATKDVAAFKYVIRNGGPITYEKGMPFSIAVNRAEIRVLKDISDERFTM